MDTSTVSNAVAIGVAALVVLPVCLLLWWLTSKLGGRPLRWTLRVLCVPVLAYSSLWIWLHLGMGPQDYGRWTCDLCGEAEYRLLLADIQVWREECGADEYKPEERLAYAEWYANLRRPPHDHAWYPAGCHHVGAMTIACYGDGLRRTPFAVLPRLQDNEIALHLLDRLQPITPEGPQLQPVLTRSVYEEPGLWKTLQDATVPAADRRGAFDAWLARNPDWR